jgi:hypothetical protein
MPVTVRAGIVAGILAGCWMFAEYYLGLSHSVVGQYTGFIGLIILLFGMYFSMRITRQKYFDGLIDYRNCVKAGIITASVGAIVMALFAYVYFEWIDTGYVEYWVSASEKYWRGIHEPEEKIQQSIINLREALRTGNQVQKVLLSNLFFGVIGSLVMSVFMKTKTVVRPE